MHPSPRTRTQKCGGGVILGMSCNCTTRRRELNFCIGRERVWVVNLGGGGTLCSEDDNYKGDPHMRQQQSSPTQRNSSLHLCVPSTEVKRSYNKMQWSKP